jgi:hypothetical protein
MQWLRLSVEESTLRIVNPFRSYRLRRSDVVSLTVREGEVLWIGPVLVRGMLRVQKAVLEVRGRSDIHVVVLDWTDDEDEQPFGSVDGGDPPDLGALRAMLSP